MKLTHIVLQNVEWRIACYCYQITTVSPIYILQQAQVINSSGVKAKKTKNTWWISIPEAKVTTHFYVHVNSTYQPALCPVIETNEIICTHSKQYSPIYTFCRECWSYTFPRLKLQLLLSGMQIIIKYVYVYMALISNIRCSKLTINFCYSR